MYTNSTRVSVLCNNLSIQKLKYTGWWIVSLKKGHTTEIWPKVLTFFTHWEDEGNALNSKEHEPAKRSHDSTRLVKVESLLVSYVGNTHPMQHRMNQVILTHVPSNWRIVDSRNTKNQQQVHMIVNNCCSLFMCEQSVKNQQQVHMIVNDCWNLFMSEQSAENQQQVHMIVIDCWNNRQRSLNAAEDKPELSQNRTNLYSPLRCIYDHLILILLWNGNRKKISAFL